ncbi:Gfo/Idh/MocA family protein [Streptomyces sp. RKAG337]|uniref:Gfo/Idh/MocA family protein n=1 Tax=Streptomyces sp. RKAG337 TaxID=2893404 RepID=UPI0020332036|nr:Gfo/Idh/MocA family oxidoreductase [Streptomyces sp. RKAG337]MCM2424545.1 Gfo/Idh/MocA family oxidoreductase [Streptomyces sp. RKAG337]
MTAAARPTQQTGTPVHPARLSSGFISGTLTEPAGRPLTIAVLGAGARGSAYADLAAERPAKARIVAVAEPRETVREAFSARHRIPRQGRFATWQEFAERPRMADIAVVSLLDADHVAATTALADLGYQLLLEKPMATNEADCEAIAEAARRNDTAMAVTHVMRYTPYTVALKQALREGAIGDIVSVQHLEPIGYYHFAHSFVRGNWRRQDGSTFLLMAKSCHDIDWLSDIIGLPVRRVSSFGSLTHFRPEQAPPGATERCVSCPVEQACAYSAKRLYQDGLRHGGTKRYFTRIISTGEPTEDAVNAALADGPYGRCVYHSDNDVVDHQVVNLEYQGGVTASFTLTAFTPVQNRHTKIFGTRGQITGDGRFIEIYDFRTERTTVIDASLDGSSAAEGHAGGDEAMFNAYLDALHSGRGELIVSGIDASLASHRVVFAAERSRTTGTVVEL